MMQGVKFAGHGLLRRKGQLAAKWHKSDKSYFSAALAVLPVIDKDSFKLLKNDVSKPQCSSNFSTLKQINRKEDAPDVYVVVQFYPWF